MSRFTARTPRTQQLQERAHALIPGGCHTYAKGDDQYPECAPAFLARGEGSHVWDTDGNEYIEYGMGVRAVTLGHAYPPVVAAAHDAMRGGTNFTRPSPLEVSCAERLLGFVHGAEMVKFAKNGSDCTTAAVKLARAVTGRDLVAYCADQPFFSVDDWFIGTTVLNAGVPDSIRALSVPFRYNDLDSVRRVFAEHAGRVACLILEPATAIEPSAGFLEGVRQLCDANDTLLVFDEMITGFRWHTGGAQAVYGVTPDLSTFGKGMGNGFSLAALAGRREFMELGGFPRDRDRVFLLSTTHGAETPSLAAGIATMQVYEDEPVIQTLHERGDRLRTGLDAAARQLGIQDHFQVVGRSSNLVYVTRDASGDRSQAFRSLFMQEIIKRGVLGPSFVVSYSHSIDDIDHTIDAVTEALRVYRLALDDGVERHLQGRSVQPVFRRLP